MTLIFNKKYFLKFLFVLFVEFLIAIFIDDNFIRPFVGDYLVMILIYLFSRTLFKCNVFIHIFGVLLFCYSVEIGQKINLVGLIGLENYRLARIIIGTHYDFRDLIAYSLGALTLIVLNRKNLSNRYE